MKKVKPFKTFEEQISILKKKNLIIEDEAKAQDILSKINYYRFINAYGLELYDKEAETYLKGTSFNLLYDIYECDKEMRHMLFSKIETIEIKLRTAIAHILGRISPLCYTDESIYSGKFNLLRFNETIEKELLNQKTTCFVAHHKNYEGIPIWALVEILPFGTISVMYNNLKKPLQKEILDMVVAESRNVGTVYFSRWVHQISILRNICAHYGRLYDRNFEKLIIKPDQSKFQNTINSGKLFNLIVVIIKIVSAEDSRVLFENIVGLIASYKKVDFGKYGLTGEWNEILFLGTENKLF